MVLSILWQLQNIWGQYQNIQLATKTRLTTIYHLTELKCYHLTLLTMAHRDKAAMPSRSATCTVVSFGHNNPKMHCEFANLETRWRTNKQDEVRVSNLTRL
jgi:hypothetical protein